MTGGKTKYDHFVSLNRIKEKSIYRYIQTQISLKYEPLRLIVCSHDEMII